MQAFVARHRPFFTLVAVLVAQLLLLSFQITRNHNVRLIQVWAVAVFDPFERCLYRLVEKSTLAWGTYGSLWRAQQQNQELHAQLLVARSQLQQLSEQADETQRLRALLEFKTHLPLQSVAVEVIATSPGDSGNAIFVDKGTDFGLVPDLAVVTPEGVVGKIIAVFRHTSQVLLITDPSSGVGCMLERSRIQGVLKGAGRNLSELHYVMNEENVAVGEAVLTSGLVQV
jgi:rod shape-determining protein MreC